MFFTTKIREIVVKHSLIYIVSVSDKMIIFYHKLYVILPQKYIIVDARLTNVMQMPLAVDG